MRKNWIVFCALTLVIGYFIGRYDSKVDYEKYIENNEKNNCCYALRGCEIVAKDLEKELEWTRYIFYKKFREELVE